MEVHSYFIPEFMAEYVQEKIIKLNKSADKLSCPRILYHETGNVNFREIEDKTYKFIEITISGNAPKLNGWKFLGTLQNTVDEETGNNLNVLRLLPGESVPASFRTVEKRCDHCMFIRDRNDTYLVGHEDGRILQVGSGCLKDFTGHANPHKIAAFAEEYLDFLRNLTENEDFSEEFGSLFGRNQPSYFRRNDYLAYVSATIQEIGWVSKGNVGLEHPISTAEFAEVWMDDKDSRRARPSLSEFQEHEIINAVAWIRDLAAKQDLTDYLWNLAVASSREWITHRDAGLVASLIPAYRREMEKQAKANAEAIGEWIGEVGKKIEIAEATVIGVVSSEGAWGVTFGNKLCTREGNIIIWWTGQDLRQQFCLNEEHILRNIKATVKAHGHFNGEKQTVVTRMKWSV